MKITRSIAVLVSHAIKAIPSITGNCLFVFGAAALVFGLSRIHEAAGWIGGGSLMLASGLGMVIKRKEIKQ